MIESSANNNKNKSRVVTPNERKEDKKENFTNILRPLTLEDYV
jgi:hypothetical protein